MKKIMTAVALGLAQFAAQIDKNFVVVREKYERDGFTEYDKDLAILYDYLKKTVSSKESLPVPSQAVDNIWHNLILDTKEYPKLCNEFFGRFIHHVPNKTETRLQKHCSHCEGKTILHPGDEILNKVGCGSCNSEDERKSTQTDISASNKEVTFCGGCGSGDDDPCEEDVPEKSHSKATPLAVAGCGSGCGSE